MARDSIKPGQYFDFKKGLQDFPGWTGLQLDADPGTMDRNGLAAAVNVRYNSGNWQARRGIWSAFTLPNAYGTTSAGATFWLGMHHLQFDPPRLWMASYGCFGATPAPGAFLEWFSSDKAPSSQHIGNYIASADRVPTIGIYDGVLYYGDYGVLYKPTIMEAFAGQVFQVGQRQSLSEEVAGFAGYETTAMQEFAGYLFLAQRDLAGVASRIDYWDGTRLVTNELNTGADYGVNFCVWRDGKLVMLQNNSATARIRTSTGTWSTVALPGAITNLKKNSMVEFRDAIYIANGSAIYKIATYDAPVATSVHTMPATTSCTALAVLTDNLYFVYNKGASPPYEIYLGYFEPDIGASNWVDAWKRIDNETGLASGPGSQLKQGSGATAMVTYRSRLYVGGGYSALVTHSTIDPGMTGSWVSAVERIGYTNQYIAALRVGG